jgi:8-oxo-dGTP pyrophosphatase MutT (NUDIX family)
MKKIKRTREVPVFSSQYGTLYNDEIKHPNGQAGEYAWWRPMHRGIAVVARRCGRIGLVAVNRYPIGETSIEIPRGMVDDGEALEQAACRETNEELGVRSVSCTVVGQLFADTGFIGAPVNVALVEVSEEPEDTTRDLEEPLGAVLWKRPEEVEQLIARGELRCAITMAALAMVATRDNALRLSRE